MNILVCYNAFTYPTRYAILDHIYCLERYSKHRVFYVNAYWQKLPTHLQNMQWDAIIFHNTFLIARSNPALFERLSKEFAPLAKQDCLKLAIAQDEHNHADALCKFINDYGVKVIYTVAPSKQDIDTIYKGHIAEDVKIIQCLAGYVEERHMPMVERYRSEFEGKQDIDIGYRSFKAKARNGRIGVLKYQISDVIAEHAPKHNLKADVSVEVKDIIAGPAWWKFIARSRYQAGVEGGTTVMDRDGAIKTCCQKFEKANPDATYEDIESACFPGKGETLHYIMASPRVFELAMAHCCQVLVEGDYSGIMQPNVHYIPIKKDFSDIDEVLASLDDEERRKRIADKAYEDLIASGKYSYKKFVGEFFVQITDYLPTSPRSSGVQALMTYYVNQCHHIVSWMKLALRTWLKPMVKNMLGVSHG